MDGNRKQLAFSTQARPWLFLALTLGVTWFFGWTAVLLQNQLPNVLILTLAYGGALTPLGFGLLLAWRHGRAFWRDFWQRIIDVRRIGWRWLAVILLFYPLKTGLAALIDVVQGGWGMAPEGITQLLERPFSW